MTLPPDQPTRARVLRDFDTTLLLEAGAGTGKTTVLVSRILALVRSGRAPAITFTEKAAGELKLRLREEIEAAIDEAKSDEERDRLKAASFDLERAPVSTIHAFAAGLLRERPFEAGLDPGFQVAAEIAGERVLEDTWEAWFDARMAEADPTLIAPFEDQFARRGIPYRLVGGREYYAREEVQSLTAVPRAIDNPRGRV